MFKTVEDMQKLGKSQIEAATAPRLRCLAAFNRLPSRPRTS